MPVVFSTRVCTRPVTCLQWYDFCIHRWYVFVPWGQGSHGDPKLFSPHGCWTLPRKIQGWTWRHGTHVRPWLSLSRRCTTWPLHWWTFSLLRVLSLELSVDGWRIWRCRTLRTWLGFCVYFSLATFMAGIVGYGHFQAGFLCDTLVTCGDHKTSLHQISCPKGPIKSAVVLVYFRESNHTSTRLAAGYHSEWRQIQGSPC